MPLTAPERRPVMRVTVDSVDAVRRAAALLAAGELVAFPTETVYGLGARADDDRAVAAIFERKGRPSGHPLIVHVSDGDSAALFASELPPVARRLMQAFWPGPLTVIVPRRPDIGSAAAGGQPTIGLRCPSHPVARDLLAAAHALGVPGVAAPSANRFGHVSPTRAAHVVAEFGVGLMVLDGGDCEVGIESAIVDCSRGWPVLLRPGAIPRDRIEAAAGDSLRAPDHAAPRASGTLASHYAPHAPLRLMPAEALASGLALQPTASGLAVYSQAAPMATLPGLIHRTMPRQADQVAHELFSVLRDFDERGAQRIWVEEPPDRPDWEGVRDRLRRASA